MSWQGRAISYPHPHPTIATLPSLTSNPFWASQPKMPQEKAVTMIRACSGNPDPPSFPPPPSCPPGLPIMVSENPRGKTILS